MILPWLHVHLFPCIFFVGILLRIMKNVINFYSGVYYLAFCNVEDNLKNDSCDRFTFYCVVQIFLCFIINVLAISLINKNCQLLFIIACGNYD